MKREAPHQSLPPSTSLRWACPRWQPSPAHTGEMSRRMASDRDSEVTAGSPAAAWRPPQRGEPR